MFCYSEGTVAVHSFVSSLGAVCRTSRVPAVVVAVQKEIYRNCCSVVLKMCRQRSTRNARGEWAPITWRCGIVNDVNQVQALFVYQVWLHAFPDSLRITLVGTSARPSTASQRTDSVEEILVSVLHARLAG
jgi:hypothetical protein